MRVLVTIAVLAAQAAAGLEGRVVDGDGKPVPRAVVYAFEGDAGLVVFDNAPTLGEKLPRALTDAEGRFSIEGVDRVEALFARDLEDRCGWLSPVTESGPVEVAIAPPGTMDIAAFRGKEGVRGERLYVAWMDGLPRLRYGFQAVTGKGGRARLRGLMPGRYAIEARHDVPQIGCCFKSVVTRRAEVVVEPGKAVAVKLGGTDWPVVAGVVRSKEGDPLHGVWVRLLPQGSEAPETVWSDVTTAEGRYALYDVPPGPYTLVGFRRLAANDGAHTFEVRRDVAVTEASEQTCDVEVDLAPFTPLEVGQAAPEIAGTRLDGEAFRLSACRGRVVVLHFYAGWCAACAGTVGEFDRIQDEFAAKGVVVVGIGLDETAPEFHAFATEKGIHHPLIFDGPWSDSRMRQAYRVANLPTSFVIDADGRLAALDVFGETLASELRRLTSGR